MRQSVKDFAEIFSQSFTLDEPIYEFGSLQVPGQEQFADLRPFFPGKVYRGSDMRPGLGVDEVHNLHDIQLPSGSVGTAISLDTFEHVEFPRKAIEEIHRVLKPDGIVVISSVMNFPIHNYPHDYWRFTPEAFRSLLTPFASSFVGYAGKEDFPHIVVGIGFKGTSQPLDTFMSKYLTWQQEQIALDRKMNLEKFVKLLVPPVFYPIFSKIYRTFH